MPQKNYQRDLDALWDKTDSLMISGRAISRTKPIEWTRTISKQEEIDSLRVALRVKAPKEGFMRRSSRWIQVTLYSQSQRLGTLYLHGQDSLFLHDRGWGSHALLVDGEAHFRWIEEQQITEPIEQRREEQRKDQIEAKIYHAWRSKMPTALRPHWDRLCAAYGVSGSPVGSLSRRINKTWEALLRTCTQQKAIRLLFSWFSYGQGNWYSGVYAEELITATLLRYFPTKKLVRALLAKRATKRQREGAVRLFGRGDVGRNAPDELAELPPGLRLRLWRSAKELTCPDRDVFVDYFTPTEL